MTKDVTNPDYLYKQVSTLNSIFSVLFCVTIAVSSCSTDSKVDSVFGVTPKMFLDSLELIGQQIQHIVVDPTKDNTIKGTNGSVLYISANSLIDKRGNPITSKAIIELKENYSLSDYISSNLQTIHGDEILQTQGMIYFSAKAEDGSTLAIDKAKPIRIEMPVPERISEAKIFKGQRDSNGNIDWKDIVEPSKFLVPFPIHFISKNRFPTECSDFYGITKDSINNYNFTFYGDLSRYENSFLATREFKERYDVACWPYIMKIYINNLDKNLWEADELAVKYFIRDSIKDVEYEINHRPPGLHGGARTKEQDEAHEELVKMAKESGHRMISIFKNFAAQKLTKLDQQKGIPDTTVVELNKAFVAYDALEFGWVNVDYFYRDPKSERVKLIAKSNEPAPIINLIIPRKNVILSGLSNGVNTYFFTKNEDGYNKLPKGEKGIILAISLVENRMHFAEKEIIIGQHETEVIELTVTTATAIKARLNSYRDR